MCYLVVICQLYGPPNICTASVADWVESDIREFVFNSTAVDGW